MKVREFIRIHKFRTWTDAYFNDHGDLMVLLLIFVYTPYFLKNDVISHGCLLHMQMSIIKGVSSDVKCGHTLH